MRQTVHVNLSEQELVNKIKESDPTLASDVE